MNGLASITIAGQKVGLKFGLPALRRVTEKMKEFELLTEGRSNDLGMAHILFAGYLNYCIMREEVPVFQLQPFYEYVESAEDTVESTIELSEAVKSFQESRYVKKAVEGEKKKAMERMETKSTGTTSSPSSTAISVIPPQTIAESPGENIS